MDSPANLTGGLEIDKTIPVPLQIQAILMVCRIAVIVFFILGIFIAVILRATKKRLEAASQSEKDEVIKKIRNLKILFYFSIAFFIIFLFPVIIYHLYTN